MTMTLGVFGNRRVTVGGASRTGREDKGEKVFSLVRSVDVGCLH